MNKATELTEDELAKLKGYMHKTPVEVEGNEEVKYLVHGAKDLEIDHDVWPIAEGGDIVKLEAGDHKCKVDGEDFVIHSTGDEWFIHSKDVANQDPTPAPTPTLLLRRPRPTRTRRRTTSRKTRSLRRRTRNPRTSRRLRTKVRRRRSARPVRYRSTSPTLPKRPTSCSSSTVPAAWGQSNPVSKT